MADPLVQAFAISNVFSRIMHFVNAGDIEVGHKHTYDHATLVSSGSVRYEVLDNYDGKVLHSKVFVAPTAVYVDKNKYHRLVALEPNTVCACIHALRTVDQDIIPPDFFIEPRTSAPENNFIPEIEKRLGSDMAPFVGAEHIDKVAQKLKLKLKE